MDDRKQFLLKMYDQMFSDINRHILVNWQSSGVLLGAFAIFSLIEKGTITLDIATSLMVVISAWLVAHLYDASYWYNRNLCIIANIERQFLVQDDLKHIHYYFGAHRPKNRMIYHLKIQYSLAVGIALIVLSYHFATDVWQDFSFHNSFSFSRSLPYIILFMCLVYLWFVNKSRNEAYAEFIQNSPGIPINTDDVTFGPGHGH